MVARARFVYTGSVQKRNTACAMSDHVTQVSVKRWRVSVDSDRLITRQACVNIRPRRVPGGDASGAPVGRASRQPCSCPPRKPSFRSPERQTPETELVGV